MSLSDWLAEDAIGKTEQATDPECILHPEWGSAGEHERDVRAKREFRSCSGLRVGWMLSCAYKDLCFFSLEKRMWLPWVTSSLHCCTSVGSICVFHVFGAQALGCTKHKWRLSKWSWCLNLVVSWCFHPREVCQRMRIKVKLTQERVWFDNVAVFTHCDLNHSRITT